jgi:hypothetical protein
MGLKIKAFIFLNILLQLFCSKLFASEILKCSTDYKQEISTEYNVFTGSLTIEPQLLKTPFIASFEINKIQHFSGVRNSPIYWLWGWRKDHLKTQTFNEQLNRKFNKKENTLSFNNAGFLLKVNLSNEKTVQFNGINFFTGKLEGQDLKSILVYCR